MIWKLQRKHWNYLMHLISFLFFFSGAKVRSEIYEAFENIYPILKGFRKHWPLHLYSCFCNYLICHWFHRCIITMLVCTLECEGTACYAGTYIQFFFYSFGGFFTPNSERLRKWYRMVKKGGNFCCWTIIVTTTTSLISEEDGLFSCVVS